MIVQSINKQNFSMQYTAAGLIVMTNLSPTVSRTSWTHYKADIIIQFLILHPVFMDIYATLATITIEFVLAGIWWHRTQSRHGSNQTAL